MCAHAYQAFSIMRLKVFADDICVLPLVQMYTAYLFRRITDLRTIDNNHGLLISFVPRENKTIKKNLTVNGRTEKQGSSYRAEKRGSCGALCLFVCVNMGDAEYIHEIRRLQRSKRD